MRNRKVKVTFSTDEVLLTKFNALWSNKSFDSSDAMNIFIKKCIEIGDIPFEYAELLRAANKEKEEEQNLQKLRAFISEKVRLFHYTFKEAFAESGAAEELRPILKSYYKHMDYSITMSEAIYQRGFYQSFIHVKTVMAKSLMNFTGESKKGVIKTIANIAFEKKLLAKVLKTDGKGIIYVYPAIFKVAANDCYEISIPDFPKLGIISTSTTNLQTAKKLAVKTLKPILTKMEKHDEIPPLCSDIDSNDLDEQKSTIQYIAIKTPNYRQDIYDMLIDGF